MPRPVEFCQGTRPPSHRLSTGSTSTLIEKTQRRRDDAEAFRDAYAAYVHPTDGSTASRWHLPDPRLRRPSAALTESQEWHLAELTKMEGDLITPTRHRFVDLSSADERETATRWWLDLTANGGEGMVVKPAHLSEGRIQSGIKVRGREYLGTIYGPDYTDSLDVLRDRHLGKKRQLAQREHGLGLEALTAFIDHEPL